MEAHSVVHIAKGKGKPKGKGKRCRAQAKAPPTSAFDRVLPQPSAGGPRKARASNPPPKNSKGKGTPKGKSNRGGKAANSMDKTNAAETEAVAGSVDACALIPQAARPWMPNDEEDAQWMRTFGATLAGPAGASGAQAQRRRRGRRRISGQPASARLRPGREAESFLSLARYGA